MPGSRAGPTQGRSVRRAISARIQGRGYRRNLRPRAGTPTSRGTSGRSSRWSCRWVAATRRSRRRRRLAGVTSSVTASLKLHQFLGGVRVGPRRAGGVAVRRVPGRRRERIGRRRRVGRGRRPDFFSTSESESSTQFAMQFGGGVTVWLSKGIGIRGSVGYLRIAAEDGWREHHPRRRRHRRSASSRLIARDQINSVRKRRRRRCRRQPAPWCRGSSLVLTLHVDRSDLRVGDRARARPECASSGSARSRPSSCGHQRALARACRRRGRARCGCPA